MSRKCKAIAAYKRRSPGLFKKQIRRKPWPFRIVNATPNDPYLGVCWGHKLTACEWRRFYRRNPAALRSARDFAKRGDAQNRWLYTRHLKRLNIKLEP